MSKGYKSLNLFFSKSDFVGSYLEYEKLPISIKPEICFLGKSNVGKSTLINRITIKKNLAKTSKKPGCTRSINFFLINKQLYFVDLPGYGFATMSKILQEKLSKLMNEYIEKRKNIKKIFLLIDSKIGLKKNDIDLISYLNEMNILFTIILTKADKCSKKLISEREKDIIDILNKNSNNGFKEIYSVGNLDNKGITNIRKNIYRCIN